MAMMTSSTMAVTLAAVLTTLALSTGGVGADKLTDAQAYVNKISNNPICKTALGTMLQGLKSAAGTSGVVVDPCFGLTVPQSSGAVLGGCQTEIAKIKAILCGGDGGKGGNSIVKIGGDDETATTSVVDVEVDVPVIAKDDSAAKRSKEAGAYVSTIKKTECRVALQEFFNAAITQPDRCKYMKAVPQKSYASPDVCGGDTEFNKVKDFLCGGSATVLLGSLTVIGCLLGQLLSKM